MNDYASQLLGTYPIISDQIQEPALSVVLSRLDEVLDRGIDGDVVEFGCYLGTTSLFIRRLLTARAAWTKHFHVYDSFAGLPAKSPHDASTAGDDFQAGELSVSRKQLLTEFHKAHLAPPIVHKAWFDELQDQDVPKLISFAFLDGDFYSSIIDSLRLVYPRLQPGGIICIDDYQRAKLPGVERAVRDYFQDKTYKIQVSHNIGVITLP